MEEIIFRKAKITDARALAELRIAQLAEEGAPETDGLKDRIFRFFEQHLETETFQMWVSIAGGEIIATGAVTFYEKPPYAQNPQGVCGAISCMYTMKPFRKKGVARQIMGKLVGEASKRSCPVLQANASKDGAGFYQEFGFEKRDRVYVLTI